MSELINEQCDKIYSYSKNKLYRSRWLFIEEGVRRGYDIKMVHPQKLIFFVEKNGKGFIYNTLPGSVTTRIRFPYIVNKIFQKKIMNAGGISVAESFAVVRDMHRFEKATIIFPCVIKPVIGSRSKNVFIDINTNSAAKKAVQEIVNAKSSAIIEQMYVGTEYRILAINGRFVSCVQRRPASIIGDGTHTIEELINIKKHSILTCCAFFVR
jgi:glutathione synthase/RimK-type ligase-like ATP-grasp enzyme